MKFLELQLIIYFLQKISILVHFYKDLHVFIILQVPWPKFVAGFNNLWVWYTLIFKRRVLAVEAIF